MSEAQVYQETIRTPLWVRLLLLGLVGGSVAALAFCRGAGPSTEPLLTWSLGLIALATLVVTLLLAMLFGRLSLLANGGELVVHFGYLPLLSKKISFDDIASAKAVRYRPIQHFSGWGIRWGRYQGVRTALYSLRGSKGVLLILHHPIETHLLKTDHIIVGSQDPLQLAEYLLPRIRRTERT